MSQLVVCYQPRSVAFDASTHLTGEGITSKH